MQFANIKKMWMRVANLIGGLLFSALFLVFVAQVTARFGFNMPLMWTDEMAVILYIWVIMWAAAFMVPEREHVVFDLLYHFVSHRVQRYMRIAGHLIIGGFSAWALPSSWNYIHFMAREGTPVIGLPLMWVFLPFALLLVSLVVRGIWQIVMILRESTLTEEKQ
ncbi:MAG: TRAP transporter small permease [Formivibrio sp.]|nr:TRAP transporter small permease [Formivibrio sp.]